MKITNLFSIRKWIEYYLGKTKGNNLSDEFFLKLKFYSCIGKRLNLENPKTYNEKLQWLKLYNRKPEYTMMVDKYLVREYVKEKLGEEYLIPMLGVWDCPDEIDFDALPDKFVLKCNHNSGRGMYICKDKSKMDVEKVRAGLEDGLRQDYFMQSREWPYKNVKRKIVAEQFMEDKKTAELRDYKFFVFDGEVKALFIATDRQTPGVETKFDFFDENFNHLPIINEHPNAEIMPEKPLQFEEMKRLASILGDGMPHVRIDFYEVNGRIYFGEITFFQNSGLVPVEPPEWDKRLGDWIKLPNKTVE